MNCPCMNDHQGLSREMMDLDDAEMNAVLRDVFQRAEERASNRASLNVGEITERSE
jgi:hypothetical protein